MKRKAENLLVMSLFYDRNRRSGTACFAFFYRGE